MSGRIQYQSLDGMRFLAAFAVMFYHFGDFAARAPLAEFGIRAAIGHEVSYPWLAPHVWWGFLGVEVFFFISGFVIALSAEGRTAVGFARARFLRLMPAFWALVALCFAITLAYTPAPLAASFDRLFRSVLLYPLGPWLDGVYWTLTVEIVFYAVVALLLAIGAFRRIEHLVQAWAVVTAALLAIALGVGSGLLASGGIAGALAGFVDSYASRPLLISTGPYFALGVLVYGMVRNGVTSRRLGFAALAAVGGAMSVYLSTGRVDGPLIWGAAMVLTLAGLAWEASGRRLTRSERIGSWLRLAGLASYPLYLVHQISGAWLLGRLIDATGSPLVALCGAMAACVVFSLAFAALAEPRLRAGFAALIDQAGPGPRPAEATQRKVG